MCTEFLLYFTNGDFDPQKKSTLSCYIGFVNYPRVQGISFTRRFAWKRSTLGQHFYGPFSAERFEACEDGSEKEMISYQLQRLTVAFEHEACSCVPSPEPPWHCH